MPESILNQGVELILNLQSWGGVWQDVMGAITFLGDEEFFLLIMPALYWCVEARLGFRMGVILLLTGALNGLLNLAFQGPRPYWISPAVEAAVSEESFGLPSGHAQISVAVWGLLASRLGRWSGWVGALALSFLIGISRVFLGVHFPTDIYAGWLVGLAGLAAFLGFESSISDWWRAKRPVDQIGLLLAVALAAILAGALTISSLAGWQVPPEWVQNARSSFPEEPPLSPLNLEEVITTMAAFFGLGMGYVLTRAQGGFEVRGPWFQRLARLVIGVAGVLALWAGLGALFPDGTTLLAYSLRFVRYGLVGLWVSWLAPWIFILARISKREVPGDALAASG